MEHILALFFSSSSLFSFTVSELSLRLSSPGENEYKYFSLCQFVSLCPYRKQWVLITWPIVYNLCFRKRFSFNIVLKDRYCVHKHIRSTKLGGFFEIISCRNNFAFPICLLCVQCLTLKSGKIFIKESKTKTLLWSQICRS